MGSYWQVGEGVTFETVEHLVQFVVVHLVDIYGRLSFAPSLGEKELRDT